MVYLLKMGGSFHGDVSHNQTVKWNDVDLGQETSWCPAESYDDPTREARSTAMGMTRNQAERASRQVTFC